jgi:hypothetical protein
LTLDEVGTATITATGESSGRSASVRVAVESDYGSGGAGVANRTDAASIARRASVASVANRTDVANRAGVAGGGDDGNVFSNGLAITGGRYMPIALGGAGAIVVGVVLVAGVVYMRRRLRANNES